MKYDKENVEIVVTSGSDIRVEWKGPISKISGGRWVKSKPVTFGFIVAAGQSMTVHSMKVKMNTGRLKLMR